MVSNSAKLDCRTKKHTESGVSTSNGSRDMARTRSAKKKKKKKELSESHIVSPTGIANKCLFRNMAINFFFTYIHDFLKSKLFDKR